MIVTLDGPAGVGKSSAARALAERLDYEFLDTGAMYRAVALAALQGGVDLCTEVALAELLPHLRLGFRPDRTLLNGEDVSARIREPQVTSAAHTIAQYATVRAFLVKLQRMIATGLDLVTEGRDQGTVVFPDAGCKFFLTADPRERAKRRLRELAAKGIEMSFDQLLRDQEDRDHRDATRAVGPMRQAEDAILLDTTGLTLDEVVDFMEQEVRRRDDV
jgi:cytidylate kinase